MRRIIPITAEETLMKKNLRETSLKQQKHFYSCVITAHVCSPVVPSSHTVVQPFAVMVEVCDALVAAAAVFGCRAAVKEKMIIHLSNSGHNTFLYQRCVPFTNI